MDVLNITRRRGTGAVADGGDVTEKQGSYVGGLVGLYFGILQEESEMGCEEETKCVGKCERCYVQMISRVSLKNKEKHGHIFIFNSIEYYSLEHIEQLTERCSNLLVENG